LRRGRNQGFLGNGYGEKIIGLVDFFGRLFTERIIFGGVIAHGVVDGEKGGRQ